MFSAEIIIILKKRYIESDYDMLWKNLNFNYMCILVV